MASASGGASHLDKLRCLICANVCTSPIRFPCKHTVCKKCIQSCISENVNLKDGILDEFACQVCRSLTCSSLSSRPVKEFKSLFPHSSISLTVGTKGKNERLCDACQSENISNPSTGVCVDCEENLCDTCVKAHRKTKASKTHKIIEIETIQENPETLMGLAVESRCHEHKKNCYVYCKTHDDICCEECLIKSHKSCRNVTTLDQGLPNLLMEINAEETITQLKGLEGHLKAFALMTETNMNSIESQVNALTKKIHDVRKRVNETFDKMETELKIEGTRIYKEEMTRKKEEIQCCHLLINTIRNSHAYLQTVLESGTDLQKVLVSRNSKVKLQSYQKYIQKNYEEIDTITMRLDLDNNLMSILKAQSNFARVLSAREIKRFPCSSLRKLPMVQIRNVVDIRSPSVQCPYYVGVVQLPESKILLADHDNRQCCLYDDKFTHVATWNFSSKPSDICLVDIMEVAVTIPYETHVDILSVKNSCIIHKREIETKYHCYGVAAVNDKSLVVCGPTHEWKKCFWSVITMDGEVTIHHEIESVPPSTCYVALDLSKSRVYLSIGAKDSVCCFGLSDGNQYFVYTSPTLKNPLGLAVDKENNVYVTGNRSNNIHKISPVGSSLQIMTSRVPSQPNRISYSSNNDQLIVTNGSINSRTRLHFLNA